jgi:mRNA-degrading endonuclease RelE of RelBE toxin-antitoxin system
MPYEITITADAQRQLRSMTARQQRTIENAIQTKLVTEPTKTTRSIKRLRPNPFAEFELRAGELRALYNVEENKVVLLIVGRKDGNKLIVEGEEFHAHRDNPTQQSGSGPAGDAQ